MPAGRGFLGITLCPGKRADSLAGARWERGLAADMQVIREWGASAVVTLIEPQEFRELHVADLPAAVAALQMEWHHLPIRDVDVPDQRFETRWVYAGQRLRERLLAGDRVLVHCRGGLGRAGMVAARLLVELGMSPIAALAAVRSVRPGAVETRAQEQWVMHARPVDAATAGLASRELACLLGGAIGDALGYRVEFDSKLSMQAKYGRTGLHLSEARGPLEVSDDTQMTLFTLEGQRRALESGKPLLDCLRKSYLDWFDTQIPGFDATGRQGLVLHRSLHRAQAPGNTCLSALAAGGRGTPDDPANSSKGCGGVMRVAPLGFLGEGHDDAAVYDIGVAAAALTHGHPDGYAPAGAMALAVRRLLRDADWPEVIEAGLEAVGVHPTARGTTALLRSVRDALAGDVTPRDPASFGPGWVGDEALAVGLHAAATRTSFESAIEAAAFHDGDSDSTAAIAGQLYGARHGLAALPASAVYRLDVLEPLLELAGRWRRLCSPPA
ncbi:MAG: ADP-ribosylglycohydrolase family protein [Gammaproteobacteria bacterium]|nr:ADP-ribosylglycohydrolase family protein [Gammaproteobacteria bacterium]